MGHFVLHVNSTDVAMLVLNDMTMSRAVKMVRMRARSLISHLGFSRINGRRYNSSNDVNNQQQTGNLKINYIHIILL